MRKRIALLLALALAICALSGCGKKEDLFAAVPNPLAVITLSDGSVMQFELYFQEAPNTVANFATLANAGFYDGQRFFRIVPGVLVQAGDPNNNGTGHADYVIQGEFAQNGIENGVRHVRGTIAMSRQEDYDTASSQFFILQGTYPEYNGMYAAFGKVVDEESLNVLDRIAYASVDADYIPVSSVPSIETIRVQTYGYKLTPATMPYPEITKAPVIEEEEAY